MKKVKAFIAAMMLCAGIGAVIPGTAMAAQEARPELNIEVVEDLVEIPDEEVPLAELQLDRTSDVMKDVKLIGAIGIVAVIVIVGGTSAASRKRREDRLEQGGDANVDAVIRISHE